MDVERRVRGGRDEQERSGGQAAALPDRGQLIAPATRRIVPIGASPAGWPLSVEELRLAEEVGVGEEVDRGDCVVGEGEG